MFTIPWISYADPRGPNFAEIHARGRRGRLESDYRDLIPPWGHGLLHGEEEKPTMAVWHDRHEGVFPSWLTAVAGKGNCTTAAHSRTGFDSRQPIQWRCLQYAATEAGTAAHNRFTPGPSRSGVVCLDTGFPGETLSRLGPYPGCTGRRAAVSLAKRKHSDGQKAVLAGVRGAKSPFFRGQRSWLGRHLSEKQQVKDGGVCRVMWTISRGSRHCNSSTAPLNSRIQPHFPTRI